MKDISVDKNKLLKIMKEKGINTQTELARKMGITKAELSRIISIKYDPVKSNIRLIADTLRVPVLEILGAFGNDKDSQLTLDGFTSARESLKENDSRDTQSDFIDVSDVSPLRSYSCLELFAGAGGLALGLERAGFQTIALVEKDEDACSTLRANRTNWKVIERNIEEVAEKGIFSFIDEQEIDLISGGYPCQAFSYAGKKLGFEDVRGTMFYYYAMILKAVKPKVFLVENVRGLVSHDRGRTLATMKSVFSEIGYKIVHRILNAVDYNVAQKRERLVLVGIREDVLESSRGVVYAFPKPFGKILTLRDVIWNVPKSPGATYSESRKEVLDMVPPGGCWRDLPKDVAQNYMGKSYFSGGGRTGMARRLSWDEPSLAVLCSPSQKQTDRCHPDETRPLTTREYARIQSFPDEWVFAGSISSVYKQIGNAVPVNFAEAIGRSLVALLNEIEVSQGRASM